LSPESQSTTASGSDLSSDLLTQSPPQAFNNFGYDSQYGCFVFEETIVSAETPETPRFGSVKILSSKDEDEIPDFEKVFPQSQFPFLEDYDTYLAPADDDDFLAGIELPKKQEPDDIDFDNMCLENEGQGFEDPYDRLMAKMMRNRDNYERFQGF